VCPLSIIGAMANNLSVSLIFVGCGANIGPSRKSTHHWACGKAEHRSTGAVAFTRGRRSLTLILMGQAKAIILSC